MKKTMKTSGQKESVNIETSKSEKEEEKRECDVENLCKTFDEFLEGKVTDSKPEIKESVSVKKNANAMYKKSFFFFKISTTSILEIPERLKNLNKKAMTHLVDAEKALGFKTKDMTTMQNILLPIHYKKKMKMRNYNKKANFFFFFFFFGSNPTQKKTNVHASIQFLKMYRELERKTKKSVTLLLVGEKGAGQTTLQQAIIDYLRQVSFEDVKVREEDEISHHTLAQRNGQRNEHPQTLSCVGENSELKVKVISTPGLIDSNGEIRDAENWEAISNCIAKLDFNAVVVVLKGNTNRHQERLKEGLTKLAYVLTKEGQKNCFILFTSSISEPDLSILQLFDQVQFSFRAYAWLDNERYKKGYNVKHASHTHKMVFDQSQNTIKQLLTVSAVLPLCQGNKLCIFRTSANAQLEELQQLRIDIENKIAVLQSLHELKRKLHFRGEGEDVNIDELIARDSNLSSLQIKETRTFQIICSKCEKTKTVCMRNCSVSKEDNLFKSGLFQIETDRSGTLAVFTGVSGVFALGAAALSFPIFAAGTFAAICYSAANAKAICRKCGHPQSRHALITNTLGSSGTVVDEVDKEIKRISTQKEEMENKVRQLEYRLDNLQKAFFT
ncbi:hypothetical protein RFI_05083 [Reticulomyxa filosa]|uniref:AIG1-type G domain-containing protein n=1 Tax=Reticulomyxa filosa TaxID=46433 RepID=X6P0E9_RETFI|nr:hypothetical protein RFI_05083 [Reticulomyxa filosa]|eukprot:ETO32035.1 hypothetical protein RFI_05083 [Reticulomyxa filosa]